MKAGTKKKAAKAVSRKEAKKKGRGTSTPKKDTTSGKQSLRKETLTSDQFTTELDSLCADKKFKEAYAFISSCHGLKKWQSLNFRAVVAYKEGNFPDAEETLLQALREPDCKPHVHKNMALILAIQGKLNQALPFAEKAFEFQKEEKILELRTIQIYLNCLLDVSKTERVLEIMDTVEEKFPDDKNVLVAKASALRSTGKRKESLELLDQLIERWPAEPIMVRIKADLLGDRNPFDALPFYEKALKLSIEKNGKPDPAIQWNMSLHLLRVRDIARGWECWEQGFHPIVGTMGRNLPTRIKTMGRADLKGKEIDTGKWTIVVSEQGIGDQVLFLSVMNEAIQEFKKILFIAEGRMHPILKRSFPKLIIAGAGMTYHWENSMVHKNGYIPLGSLPRRYRPDPPSFEKGRAPFLVANKTLYQKYRKILREKAAGRPIIGISWKGGYWQIQRKTKQLELSNWLPIFKKDAIYVNLQYGDISNEVKYLRENKQEIYFFQHLDFKRDLDDWVALAGACDGIISVSTALVHFAGAIGQKVAVVMPGEQGPWHLGLEDTESFAYKNVAFIGQRR